jgi:tetratricopeptide (TPR) repeat protein
MDYSLRKSFLKSGLKIFIVCFINLAFAANPPLLSSPETTVSNTSIRDYEKDFNFDWEQFTTILPNKNKIKAIEAYISTLNATQTIEHLTSSDRKDLGKLLYKLGTYYTHVSRQPKLAIIKLYEADKLLNTNQDKAWIYNHLAYAYEQKYAKSADVLSKEKGLYYTNLVMTRLYPDHSNKAVAFAYCVQGLILNDSYDYKNAEESFRHALLIYEMLDNKGDQYARAKNRLADIILDQNGRDNEAITLFKNLKAYWSAKQNINEDPYAARNLLSLGRAYLKIGEYRRANIEINNAIKIYINVYGANNSLLARPYHLLAEVYKKTNQLKQAAEFEAKSENLAKA